MVSKKEKFNIWFLAVLFLLGGILHVLLRNVDFTDCFSQVFYGCVVLLWSVTISERIVNNRARHILYGVIIFMEMYFVLQICKYRLFFNNGTVWSYYYIPMVIIPILLFYLALGLNRQEQEKLDKRWHLVTVPGVLLTSMPDGTFLEKARKAKADSFWYKEVQDVPLLEIMDRTMAGEHVYPDDAPIVSIGTAKSTDFTSRELEVLRYVAAGYSDKEIAQLLIISYGTVRAHLNNLLQKTDCASRTELAILAAKTGIVVPEI